MRNKTLPSILKVTLAILIAGPGLLAQNATPLPTPRPKRPPQPDQPFQLQALTPEFWKVFSKDAKLVTMGTGLKFTEGPVWDSAGFLWLSDEQGNKILHLYPDGHTETMVEVTDPDGSTFDRNHRFWSTSSGLRAILELAPDGKSFVIAADHYDGKKLNTPNDIVTGPDGALYFTDPTIDMTSQQQQEQPQSIYRLDPTAGNKLTLLTRDLTAPNGIAFSPNGKYLYIDDGKIKGIRRYRFHNGTLSDGIMFSIMVDPNHRGAVDGMKLDRHGRLFVSGPNGMWVINSKGQHIGTIEMPHSMANLAWGGPDASTLYLTAGHTVYILQTKTRGFLPYEAKSKFKAP